MTFKDDDDQDQPNHLEHEFLRYKLDILGVSEARWLGSGTVKTPSGHTVFLYSGKDEGGDKTAGVGFTMTPKTHSCLISWKPISERMIIPRFRSKIRKTLIQCYVRTEKSSGNVKDDFYNWVDATHNKVPRGDNIAVMGNPTGSPI